MRHLQLRKTLQMCKRFSAVLEFPAGRKDGILQGLAGFYQWHRGLAQNLQKSNSDTILIKGGAHFEL